MSYYPTIAIVGCGAIVETFYLPSFHKLGYAKNKIILVDTNNDRLHKLGDKFELKKMTIDYRKILNKVDGVIITTPSYLHFEQTIQFLKNGVYVLSEKPLVTSFSQYKKILNLEEKSGYKILINHTKRLFPVSIEIKNKINSGVIGKPLGFDYSEGGQFTWPTASGFYFQWDKGVLIDRGSHAVDLVCWWLGKPKSISYIDDSFGGSEAVALLNFKINSCKGRIKFNLFNKLSNKYYIKGAKGEISGDIYDFTSFLLTNYSDKSTVKITLPTKQKTYFDFADILIRNFIDMISNHADPLISVSDIKDSVETIDYCYRHRQRFNMPWF
ncbi:Gfo/Idh/MocA family oxidoreductase [Candidatus Collierbacteria bacterium]|nr:Gfo/Idh/MocA family oxidoreductase [Candidatus Collierbacteria bacterium]